MITSINDLVSGKHYIIASKGVAGSAYAMGAQKYSVQNVQTNRNGVPVTVSSSNNGVYITEEEGVYEFVINGPEMITKNNQSVAVYTIYDAQFPGYLYAGSSSVNYLNTQSFNDANGQWTIEIANTGSATVKAQGSNTRNQMRFNSNLFACYSSGQSDIFLYVKDNDTNYEFYKDITGVGTDPVGAAGYYLIASPVTSVTPTATNGFITNGYDLYRFNQSAALEWENYHQHNTAADPFLLQNGTGYLYANSNDVTIVFEGQPYNGDGIVDLAYDEDAPHSKMVGVNLIGNPFGKPSYLSDNRYFFVMNDERDELIPGSGSIGAMEGIFVYAEFEDENVTFTTTNPSEKSADLRIILNIIGNNDNVIDRAIVRFDEGGTLPKFTLREDNTKIYIPMEDKDYAVVRGEGKGTLPVNFKTKEIGKYTISVDTKGLDMSYLHLIDRLTGDDVNLLIDNEYSFIASKNDTESRFILSFTENGYNAESEDTFAFQSGEGVIVSGEGELQVFDVTGRMVMSAMVNGIETVNGLESGVYVFRMVGNDVKTQKIVVR